MSPGYKFLSSCNQQVTVGYYLKVSSGLKVFMVAKYLILFKYQRQKVDLGIGTGENVKNLHSSLK